nr:hypothetical protein [uncultured Dysosmobacter sp.]
MTQRAFETKKNFVRQTWSRCVCEMFPGVVRVEYHLHDDGSEVAVIRYDTGYLWRVDVTGLALHETAQAILAALGREAA